jgi:hypothetical protein
MRDTRNGFRVLIRKPEIKRSLEDLDIHERIILKFMGEC